VLVQFLVVVLAGWLARRQEAFIEYLKAENRMLKARLGRRRILSSASRQDKPGKGEVRCRRRKPFIGIQRVRHPLGKD
jgi:hypothetical protein